MTVNLRSLLLFSTLILLSPCLGAQKGRVKVFILSGQSNMVGWANIRTLDHLGKDPKHASLLGRIKPERFLGEEEGCLHLLQCLQKTKVWSFVHWLRWGRGRMDRS